MRGLRALILLSILWALPTAAEAPPPVILQEWRGAIGPMSAEYLRDGIELAEERGAGLLVFALDTPGGLDTAMREMVQDILASPVPVAVFVHPDGARAASAGVFLLAASHVAAMAPSTNTGAAHPVAMGGQMDETMAGKVTNDAVAYLTGLARGRERPTEWCEAVVRESASHAAEEALELGVIDCIAPDLDALLAWCDGRTVQTEDGPVVLATAGAEVVERPQSARQKFIRRITEPNMAYLFLMLGLYGLFFELSRPGAILPGVVGAISLLLAVLAFQGLPVNYVGVALIVLGIVLFILEAQITSYGALALGGGVSVVLGSLLLFENAGPLGSLSLKVLVPVVVFTFLLFFGIVGLGLRALRRPPTSGDEALAGLVGEVRALKDAAETGTEGKLNVNGEYWDFDSTAPVRIGERVRVRRRRKGRLEIEPYESTGG